MQCPSCGCNEIDQNDASGESVCINCGTVLEENGIVSSIEFQEQASGAASVMGQYVSSTAAGGYGAVNASGRHYSKESREMKLAAGRRRIAHLAGLLHLGSHYTDSAYRLYMLAVQRNFTTGRRTQNVIAACLYAVCRREKSPHLLIDFSDKLQTNVFVLGSVFLKFCRLLNLLLPVIDPSLYIHRFAAQLNLQDKTHAVATTALRLVATMKRDWIEVGRRPSGICGAALLIASRTHKVECTRSAVMRVVQVSDQTLTKRLDEFAMTPAAQLTFEEFGRITFEGECNPPIFIKHQQEKALKLLMNKDKKLLTSGESSSAKALGSESALVKRVDVRRLSDKEISEILVMQRKGAEAEPNVEIAGVDGFNDEKAKVSAQAVENAAYQAVQRVKQRASTLLSSTRHETMVQFYDSIERDLTRAIKEDMNAQPDICSSDDDTGSEESSAEDSPPDATKKEILPVKKDTDTEKENEVDDGSLSDLDDDEIDRLLLSKTEVSKKTKLWTELNAEYLQEQKEKAEYELAHGKPITKKRRRSTLPESTNEPEVDPAITTLKNKRRSKKINYDVLNELLSQH